MKFKSRRKEFQILICKTVLTGKVMIKLEANLIKHSLYALQSLKVLFFTYYLPHLGCCFTRKFISLENSLEPSETGSDGLENCLKK